MKKIQKSVIDKEGNYITSRLALPNETQTEEGYQLVLIAPPYNFGVYKGKLNDKGDGWVETATPEEIEAAKPKPLSPQVDENLLTQLAIAEVYEKQLMQDEDILTTQLAVAEIYELLG